MFNRLLEKLSLFRSQSRRKRRSRRSAAGGCESLEARELLTFTLGKPTGFDVQLANTYNFVLADFDGDGDQDLAVSAQEQSRITVALNDGSGSWSVRQRIITDQNIVNDIALADMNGDGWLDLVNSENGLLIYYPSRGDGTFGNREPIGASGMDGAPWTITDLNNNGVPEIIVQRPLNSTTFALGVYWDGARNNGSGDPIQQLAQDDFTGGNIVVADIDSNGRPDIVVTNSTCTVHVFLQFGNQNFSESRLSGIGGYGLAVGDLDGNGRPDLASNAPQSDSAMIWWNAGSGQFLAGQLYGVGGDAPADVEIADVDGDGRNDLVSANRGLRNNGAVSLPGDSVSVLLSFGGRRFASPAVFAAGRAGMGEIHPGSVRIADVNSDGVPDAVVGHNDYYSESTGRAIPTSTFITVLPGVSESTLRKPDLTHTAFAMEKDVVDLLKTHGIVRWSRTVKNLGDAEVPGDFSWAESLYISRDKILDSRDKLLTHSTNSASIAAGRSQTFRNIFSEFPSKDDPWWSGNGTYYVLAKADGKNQLDEWDETNNSGKGLGVDMHKIQVIVSETVPPTLEPIPDTQMWRGQKQSWIEVTADDADGDRLTYRARAVSVEWFLDQKYRFVRRGSDFRNQIGLNEKWVWSENESNWYFITPMGQLFRWNGGTGSTVDADHIANLTKGTYFNPAKLHSPPRANVPFRLVRVRMIGETVQIDTAPRAGSASTIPFVVEVGVSDGVHSVQQSFEVSRQNSMAERIDESLKLRHTTDYRDNRLGLNERWISSSRGWHYILPDGEIHRLSNRNLVAVVSAVYYQHPDLLHDASVFAIDQDLGLYQADNSYYENWGGRNEKWLFGRNDQWYFVLPNGDLYEWDGVGVSANGTLIASLGSSAFYQDPRLIHDAQARTMDGLLGLQYFGSSSTAKYFSSDSGRYYELTQEGSFRLLNESAPDDREEFTLLDRVYWNRPGRLADAI